MPWWGWLLIGWGVAATACAVWFGLALTNAERKDRKREDRAASSPE